METKQNEERTKRKKENIKGKMDGKEGMARN